ncbi:MAG: formylglycine-generating enzyme family protein [Candidatus Electrothrix sp. AR3]|nr:formylglycine-generating enzyme family protein [Candidatus Electrothrix sp. AR3]
MTKPAWANIAQGCQPGGKEYFHLVTQGEEQKELAWCDPGEYSVRNQEGKQVATFWLKKGFFAVLDETEEIQTQGFQQPSWAESIGVDEYGLYTDLVFRGVTQRFRWIQPGRFMMGSPEDEPERRDNEGSQHEVILTESYWLADTACSQMLWQAAVTGENPSGFKGEERPVEQISWGKIQQFIKQLNKEIPSLKLSLPTEAQWEYACRAGTTTPFFFGANITPEQVNYNGKYPYTEGKKGENRAETVDVKALPCNQWGLYQMHGNVWEWCQDWYGDYSVESVIDPQGPATGKFRVCRGGSWIYFGRYCRSAFRDWSELGYRDFRLGFRLARGRSSKSSQSR